MMRPQFSLNAAGVSIFALRISQRSKRSFCPFPMRLFGKAAGLAQAVRYLHSALINENPFVTLIVVNSAAARQRHSAQKNRTEFMHGVQKCAMPLPEPPAPLTADRQWDGNWACCSGNPLEFRQAVTATLPNRPSSGKPPGRTGKGAAIPASASPVKSSGFLPVPKFRPRRA